MSTLGALFRLHTKLCDDWRPPSQDWLLMERNYRHLQLDLQRQGIDVEKALRKRFCRPTKTKEVKREDRS